MLVLFCFYVFRLLYPDAIRWNYKSQVTGFAEHLRQRDNSEAIREDREGPNFSKRDTIKLMSHHLIY